MRLRLSVIVVSRDTRELLARCLESVHADPVGAGAEVWVVDNASADGSPQMVAERFPGVRLIVNDANLGFAAACNQALLLASGPILLLLNSDAALAPGALETLCTVLENRPEIGVAGGQLIGPGGVPQRSYGRIPTVGAFLAEMLGAGGVPGIRRIFPEVASPPRRREQAREVAHVCGACMAFRRETLNAVGPLDERFFLYFEETDFCLRVRRDAGLVVWFEPAVRVRHEGRASARRLGREAEIHYARSASAFVRKHYGDAAARRLAAAFGLWLGAQVLVHRLQALARKPGALDSIARKRRLMGLHRALGTGEGTAEGLGWAS